MLEIVGLPWDVAAHEIARIHKCVYTKVTVDNNIKIYYVRIRLCHVQLVSLEILHHPSGDFSLSGTWAQTIKFDNFVFI